MPLFFLDFWTLDFATTLWDRGHLGARRSTFRDPVWTGLGQQLLLLGVREHWDRPHSAGGNERLDAAETECDSRLCTEPQEKPRPAGLDGFGTVATGRMATRRDK